MECMVFSIHDTQTDEVFVASDPSGQKTIYVYEDAESILFSSEMSPLISNQNRIKTLNPSAIGEYIAHEFISGKETHINEISKIGPGCCMRIKHDEDHVYVDHSRFYKASIGNQSENDIEKIKSGIRSSIDKSCAQSFDIQVPSALLLSGGVDSTAVLANGKKSTAGIEHTYSVGLSASNDDQLDPDNPENITHTRCGDL